MARSRARPRAPPFIDPPGYARHRPEATLLDQLVARHYPEFAAVRAAAASASTRSATAASAGQARHSVPHATSHGEGVLPVPTGEARAA